jgi:hypothetical protein
LACRSQPPCQAEARSSHAALAAALRLPRHDVAEYLQINAVKSMV